jgi:hypothetical protein
MNAWEMSGGKTLWEASSSGSARVCSPPNVLKTYVVHALVVYDEERIEPPIVPETMVLRNVLDAERHVLVPGQCVDAVEGSLFLAFNDDGEAVECGVVDPSSPSGYRRVECPSSDKACEAYKRVSGMGFTPSLPYTIGAIVELLGRVYGFNLNPI